MDIVVISNFCMDFAESDKERFYYVSKMLAKQGHKVELITSDFFHIKKSKREPLKTKQPIKITFLHEAGYPKNICFRRFYSHYIFGKNVERYIKTRKKPDIIYCAVPSLTSANLIAKYCEKEKVRFVVDVQDLWPEAFQMVFNIPFIRDIIFSPFKIMANGIYKRADAICAVSNTYLQRALSINKKCKESATVFLGTDLDIFEKYAIEHPVLEKKTGEIWLAYCGTLGRSYDLPLIFEAMKRIDNKSLRFLIMGDGPSRNKYEKMSKGLNVTFTGWISYKQICAVLNMCDITVNPIVSSSAASIINKHADYAMSGKPVINTQNSNEYKRLVDKYEMGFNCNSNDPRDVAEKMVFLIENDKLRQKMGKNSRKCAEECFDRKITYNRIVELIVGDVDNQIR